MTLLLKAATIIDPNRSDLHGKKRDILIENGTIAKIASRIKAPAGAREIHRNNLHVSRGWFDSGVCFGEPGYEQRETLANGLEVAAASGFTAVVLNPNTLPVPDTSGDISFFKQQAKKAVTALFPLGCLSLGSKGEDLAELFDMQGAGAVGFSDFKTPLENPNLLKLALLYSQNFQGLVYSFPLDTQLARGGQVNESPVSVRLGLRGIPNLSEHLRVTRDLEILSYTGGRLHIPTISTAAAVSLIGKAKKKGLDVTCSVAIHNLLFTDAELESFDSAYKVMPPLRSEKDRKALIKGLKEGVIDFASSDHSPLDIEEKRLEFDRAAFGSIGLESAFGALNALMGLEHTIEVLCRGRSRYGIPESILAEGERADLSLFDPDIAYSQKAETLCSTSKNSLYIGKPLKGKAYGVIAGSKTNLV